MLSKNQIKLINSLQQKKYRNKTGLFIVEGEKSVREFLTSNFELEWLFYLEDEERGSWEDGSGKLGSKEVRKLGSREVVRRKTEDGRLKTEDRRFRYSELISESHKKQNDSTIFPVSLKELQKISALKNANTVLAVFKIPKELKILEKGLILVLDDVKDPGNLGTIIRLCDWFGVQQLVCSLATVDCYNPKVVQASMGSLSRVPVLYTNLENYLSSTTLPVYSSLLEGENVYETKLSDSAILVMGNEANGISKNIQQLATHQLNIPHFGKTAQTESLNVAMATAVLLSEFRR